MNVEVIVDSTVDVPEDVRRQLTVVPLAIHFEDREFLDGVTLDKRRFYELLVESNVLPTTSQASPAPPHLTRCSGGCAAAAAAPWC